ncbi:MAG: SurA N-terminal domain-containing protein [Pseudomonas sp.]|uniref:SurA N-terminal domain-containing protein n=1 Tax=Pseudomonas sp. TaxID=306 RepID=UPI0027350946|nr:SurA N-terminal domain-containing protein [Pseudomonas sp.]MDP3845114.1 SurA N-terminal domain-containing protein [Pseudomonas sp.]
MLQDIRDKSQGWIAKTIIGVIVVLMAFTGVEAIFQATSNSQDAAEVNGEAISQSELAQAADLQRRQMMQRLGKDFDASLLDDKMLKDAALKGLIERKILLQSATSAGFALSSAALDQVILQIPAFQEGGKFNADLFDQRIRQQGFTRMQFRQELEKDILTSQLQAGVAGSGFVTDEEIQAFARLEKQTRDFATLALKADPKAVKLSDEQLQAYYNERNSQFMSQEQVVLEYIELKKAAFFDQVEVKDEDLQSAYQKEIASLAEQRQAAHILLEVNDKLSDAQARAQIEALKQRLDQGEDFAKLAKEFSKDPGSATKGGDLGYAAPGVYDPAFEEALYGLKQGDVSAPVRSQFGWHLIKLLGVQAPQVPSFASLKDKLINDLKAQQVEARFVEVSKELEDAAFEASDLAQPAQEQGLQVKTSAAFGREGGVGVTANRQVIQAAFSQEVLEDSANSGAIELDPETVVVLRVKEHHKPALLPFAEVSAGIREQLTVEHASEAVKAKGEALLVSLREGKTPVAQAQDGQAWKLVEAATRNQEGVDPLVLQQVFRMPKPASADKPTFVGVSLAGGDFVLVRLNGVNAPVEALSDEEKAMYRRFLTSRSGQQDFTAYSRQQEVAAKIERF